ncbi:thiamine pyrophosphate-dependent enzyme [Terracidiphilus gabretensis]|uniref:thiamine pyrophosphate-dependent enzyme n=1 Tax=Terracidiphilus gabretensis TaxID=1577687 RepID=UPI00071B6799|nr:thiamine pyrophosphate-dependent enzyme [Terracidiphilus gabretensis]
MAIKSSKPKAAVSAKAEKKEEFSLISNTTLKALYADLRKCERVAKRGGSSATFDAMISGVLMDLGEGDAVASAGANDALRLKRAGKPSVGAGFDAVVGAALLAKTHNSRKVSVVFGEADAVAFQDALAAARQYALPLILVSRGDAADEIAEKRAVRRPAKKSKTAKHVPAEGHLPRMYVDANDVVAVYRVAHEAIDRARRGRGATWIEGIPFKPEGKRLKADAVAGMELYLRGKGLL